MNFKKVSSALLRLALCLSALLAFGNMRAQENKVYVPNTAILDYEVYQIPVYLDTAEEVYAANFDITLPEQLQFYGENPVIASDRVLKANTYSCTPQTPDGRTQRIVIAKTTLPLEPVLSGKSGPACYLVVKAQPGTIESKGTCQISISKISAATYKDNKVTPIIKNGVSSGNIYLGHDVSKCKIYSTESNIVINPGTEHTISMNMDNNHPNYGMLFHVITPEGLSVVDNSLEITTRCQSSTTVSCNAVSNNKWVMMLYNDAKETIEGNSGVFCTFRIAADETYDGTSQITFTRVEAVDGDETHSTVEGTWEPITVTSGKIALDKARAEIAMLRSELAETMADIAEQAPLVKDKFTADDINAQIDALEKAVNAAYEGMTLTSDYDNVMAPAQTIRDAMDTLLSEAVAANKAEADRVAANKAAYDADMAKIAGLQKKYDDTVAIIKAEYAEYENAEAEAAVQTAINDAKAAVEAAFQAVAEEGVYDGSVDPESIEMQIEKLLADAKDAEEAKRVADNKAAYDADMAKINALQDKYDETVLTIKDEYKDFEDVRAEAAVHKAINDAKEAVEAAFQAVAEEGVYDGSVDTESIEKQIEKLLADAKEAKEAKRVADNKAAYDADMADIAKLRKQYDAMIERIGKAFPDYDGKEQAEIVKTAIDEAEKDVENAYADVAEEGEYESPLDYEQLSEQIDNLYDLAVSGVDTIYTELDGDVRIYTLDGIRHTELVKGQVNILVFGDNTCKKIFVRK